MRIYKSNRTIKSGDAIFENICSVKFICYYTLSLDNKFTVRILAVSYIYDGVSLIKVVFNID